MQSGDCPGLQNRRTAGHPVAGGFDPHSLPPFIWRHRRACDRCFNLVSPRIGTGKSAGRIWLGDVNCFLNKADTVDTFLTMVASIVN